jgi:hypothetical protein
MEPLAMRRTRPESADHSPGPFYRALHLCALVQFAVAYPLYQLLSRNPEFFVARQSQPVDIWLLVLALTVGLPAGLFGLQALASWINRSLGRAIHLLLIAVLFLLLGLSVSSRVAGASAALPIGVAIGVLLTLAYWRTRAGSLFVTFLAPAIVAVPVLFLLDEQVASLLRPVEREPLLTAENGRESAPLVFIVFDELPTVALLNEAGQIDPERFPNFARLAGTSHWFPNATTVATSTVLAIPPMLTGRYPVEFVMPHHGEYPDNLFTWLGNDYDLNVREAVSALCPKSLCGLERLPAVEVRLQRLLLDSTAIYLNIVAAGFLPGQLPVVTQSWEDFWGTAGPGGEMYEHRLRQMEDFVDQIHVTAKPGLDFMHVNFPHIPYEYLPSGKRYPEGWLMPGLDFATDVWTGADWQTAQAHERFMLQLRALDGWLGKLLDRLENLALFDRTLIVVTADHGVAFTPGASRRDTPPLENLDRNILPVPLIIKAPFQTEGVVSRRNAETIDILPTLADILNRPLGWAVDGSSLLGEPRPPAKRAFYRHKELAVHQPDTQRIEEALLQSAAHAPGGESSVEATSGQQALIGKPVSELSVGQDATRTANVADLALFESVSLDSDFLPAHVSGVIQSPEQESTRLAIALNGRIATFTRSYRDNDAWKFSAMLPEAAFLEGKNSLEIFALGPGDDGEPALTFIGPRKAGEGHGWRLVGDIPEHGGARLTIDGDGIQGQIDYVSRNEGAIEVFGWAVDAAQRRTVQSILVFDRGRLVYQGETRMLREETHQFGVVVKVGFHAVIPASGRFARPGSDLRVFAVTGDGRARELQQE